MERIVYFSGLLLGVEMIIGVDFDNTIVCYDELFHQVALEQNLIPASLPISKVAVRDYLRREGKEVLWTSLQGYVYGPRILEAKIFPGVKDFFSLAINKGHQLNIVSHKTLNPIEGPKYDLHQSATDCLQHNQFFSEPVHFPKTNLFFEITKENKISRIRSLGCDVFIDDLPEFLSEPTFPTETKKYLFDPNNEYSSLSSLIATSSWKDLSDILLK